MLPSTLVVIDTWGSQRRRRASFGICTAHNVRYVNSQMRGESVEGFPSWWAQVIGCRKQSCTRNVR